ncbi:ABC transporter permease [Fulvivirga sp. RKSG066]|uniref:ABC transporter permease n=1 Tax=Fulvivirga aurantia TaxID=2529383 RepID=UPI0012BC47E2|nr:ABC transporter permease [Fulvivirga aurantia]MTI21420.1 ABC transporter permease [Fulvivirga aurantia]
MLSNHLIIIIRNLRNSPLYFFLNLLGLAVGIASCMVLLHYTSFEENYDQFQSNYRNKYRLLVSDPGGLGAHTPAPIARLIEEDISQVMTQVQVRNADGILKAKDGQRSVSDQEEQLFFATLGYFKMFNQELLEGDPKLLSEPNHAFITTAVAEKYFGKTSGVVGKEITHFDSNFGENRLVVGGIMANERPDTHLPVRVVMSMNTIANNDQFWARFDNWGWMDFYTYVELHEDVELPQTQLNAFLDKHIGRENRERGGLELQLQPLSAIHLSPDVQYNYRTARDPRVIFFLQIVSIFVLLMACINYVNLAGARGLKRAREVGVRKNLGASRFDLIKQFSLESLVINLLACVLALTVTQLLWPVLGQRIGGAFTQPVTNLANPTIIIVLGTALIWTIIQPSVVIASFPAISSLKGNMSNFGIGKTYRKASVVVQFAVSLTLLITSLVIYQQISFFQNHELGIDIDQKLIIHRPKESVEEYGTKALTFKNQVQHLAMAQVVSISGSVPTKGYNYSTNSLYQERLGPNEVGEYGVNITYIDNDFMELYDAKLIAGESSFEAVSGITKAIINKKALDPLLFENPEQAIGAIIINGEERYEIIGVIDDYQHNSIKQVGQPVLYILENNAQYFTVAYSTGDQPLEATGQILREVQDLYDQTFPDTNFNYTFLDEAFAAQYRYEVFFSQIILVFTSLAMLLAILGLFGLSLYNMERKTKEVGIRKTLGASALSLFVSNTRPFVRLIFVASLMAVPISYWLMERWLSDYTFRIDLQIWSFAIPVLGLMAVALFTISYHLLKLQNTNPVESLRYE